MGGFGFTQQIIQVWLLHKTRTNSTSSDSDDRTSYCKDGESSIKKEPFVLHLLLELEASPQILIKTVASPTVILKKYHQVTKTGLKENLIQNMYILVNYFEE